jgi:hypothetical protein
MQSWRVGLIAEDLCTSYPSNNFIEMRQIPAVHLIMDVSCGVVRQMAGLTYSNLRGGREAVSPPIILNIYKHQTQFSPVLLGCLRCSTCACPAASVMSMAKVEWRQVMLKLTGVTGEEHAANEEAAHDDQPKSKASRSLKTPLQKEALEAAYSSQFHLIRLPHILQAQQKCYVSGAFLEIRDTGSLRGSCVCSQPFAIRGSAKGAWRQVTAHCAASPGD